MALGVCVCMLVLLMSEKIKQSLFPNSSGYIHSIAFLKHPSLFSSCAACRLLIPVVTRTCWHPQATVKNISVSVVGNRDPAPQDNLLSASLWFTALQAALPLKFL